MPQMSLKLLLFNPALLKFISGMWHVIIYDKPDTTKLFILMVSRTKNIAIIIHTAYIYCLIFKSCNCFFENVIIIVNIIVVIVFWKFFFQKFLSPPFLRPSLFGIPPHFSFLCPLPIKPIFGKSYYPLTVVVVVAGILCPSVNRLLGFSFYV